MCSPNEDGAPMQGDLFGADMSIEDAIGTALTEDPPVNQRYPIWFTVLAPSVTRWV